MVKPFLSLFFFLFLESKEMSSTVAPLEERLVSVLLKELLAQGSTLLDGHPVATQLPVISLYGLLGFLGVGGWRSEPRKPLCNSKPRQQACPSLVNRIPKLSRSKEPSPPSFHTLCTPEFGAQSYSSYFHTSLLKPLQRRLSAYTFNSWSISRGYGFDDFQVAWAPALFWVFFCSLCVCAFTVALAGEVGKAHFCPGTFLEGSWRGGVSDGSSSVKSMLGFTSGDRQRALPAVCLWGSLCESTYNPPLIFFRTPTACCKVRWAAVHMDRYKCVLHYT